MEAGLITYLDPCIHQNGVFSILSSKDFANERHLVRVVRP